MHTSTLLGAIPTILLALSSSALAQPTTKPSHTTNPDYKFQLRLHAKESGAPFDSDLLIPVETSESNVYDVQWYGLEPVAKSSKYFRLEDGLLQFTHVNKTFVYGQEIALGAPVGLGVEKDTNTTGYYDINLANNRLGVLSSAGYITTDADDTDTYHKLAGDEHWAVCYDASANPGVDGPLLWFGAFMKALDGPQRNCTKVFIEAERV